MRIRPQERIHPLPHVPFIAAAAVLAHVLRMDIVITTRAIMRRGSLPSALLANAVYAGICLVVTGWLPTTS